MTPTEAITALEKALEAYESVETDLQGIQAFWALIAAASPVSLRTLLDAHVGALRDAEALRAALRVIAEVTPNGWHKDDGAHVANSFIHSARAALATNTKAQP